MLPARGFVGSAMAIETTVTDIDAHTDEDSGTASSLSVGLSINHSISNSIVSPRIASGKPQYVK